MQAFEMSLSTFYTHSPDCTLAAYLSNRFTNDCNRQLGNKHSDLILNYHVLIVNIYFGLSLYRTEKSLSLSYKTEKGRCGFGGLEVACWPLVPKFAGSNPTEAVGFFRAEKSSARLPSERK